MRPIEHNGPGFYYIVRWKRDNFAEWNSECIKNWMQSNYTVSNQSSFVRYRITVEAYNVIGKSVTNATEVIGYSGEGIPTEAPTNLTVTYTNCTSVILHWNPVSQESVNGHFKAYTIQMWNYIDDGEYKREIQVKNDSTEVTISELIPDVPTLVQISVLNKRYQGPPSDFIEISKEFYAQNFSSEHAGKLKIHFLFKFF